MLRQAIDDPRVQSIVLNVNSPGGSIFGIDELAGEIFKARGEKRIVAIANSLMASAAYWIGSAADELVVTPSGEIGSIGVIGTHMDRSRSLEKEGIKMTLISAGEFKAEDSSYAPLSDEARAAMKARLDSYYGMFVETGARSRGITPARVHMNYGRGRMLTAKDGSEGRNGRSRRDPRLGFGEIRCNWLRSHCGPEPLTKMRKEISQ
jgi:signal peptide peptidase SppA